MIEEFHIKQIFHPPLLLHLDIQFIEAAGTKYSCHWIRAGKYQTLRHALVILFGVPLFAFRDWTLVCCSLATAPSFVNPYIFVNFTWQNSVIINSFCYQK